MLQFTVFRPVPNPGSVSKASSPRAREVLSECGYAYTTTTEIDRRLRVSEATIFPYFSSKRDLCVRVISDWCDEICAELENGVPRIMGTRAQIEDIVRMHLHHLVVDGAGLCELILSAGRAKNGAFGETVVAPRRRYTAPLMKVLSAGRRSGEIRDDVPVGAVALDDLRANGAHSVGRYPQTVARESRCNRA